MKLLDDRGRLFGKVSILDVGAALTILAVVIGIFFIPGTGGSVAQVGATTKPVEIDAVVRGLSVLNPESVMGEMRTSGKVNLVVRNQPYGSVEIKNLRPLSRDVLVPQPDGTVKAMADPRSDIFSTDMLITLSGKATLTPNGPVLGNSKMKIGTPIELEGKTYNFNASVIDVRILE
ncbi:MAG: DUF4330 domain-containing protein [Cyanophyceae cyanobacterium]